MCSTAVMPMRALRCAESAAVRIVSAATSSRRLIDDRLVLVGDVANRQRQCEDALWMAVPDVSVSARARLTPKCRPCHANARCSRLGRGHQHLRSPSVPEQAPAKQRARQPALGRRCHAKLAIWPIELCSKFDEGTKSWWITVENVCRPITCVDFDSRALEESGDRERRGGIGHQERAHAATDDGKEFDRLVCCDEGDAMFVPRHMLEGSAGTRSIPLHTDLLLKSISLSRRNLAQQSCGRVSTRYDKPAASYFAFIQLASIRL